MSKNKSKRCLERKISKRCPERCHLIMMNGVSGQLAYNLVESIRIAFESITTKHDNLEIRATLSAGVASYPDHGDDAWNIIRLADEAMYHAKSTGRNRVAMHQT